VVGASLPSAGVAVNPSAVAPLAHPHTIILLASARSRCFLMMTAANAISAAAAITIQIRDLMGMPPWTGRAEGVNAMPRLSASFLMVSYG